MACVPLSFAQGGPPMLTDDPGTPGSGGWEINIAYLHEQGGGDRLHSFPHVDFNYGLGEHIQLKYETGWVFGNTPEGRNSGLDDSLFGLKWRFLDQAEAGINMSMYPQLQLQNSGSSVAHGLAEPAPNLYLPVEISHEFGRTRLVGELGYQYFHSQQDQWIGGVLVSFQASELLELLAEVRAFSERSLHRSDAVLNLGLRRELGSKFRLLASAGAGTDNGPQPFTFIAYLGIQVILGEEKKNKR
jgi:hypothetical protein